MQGTLTTLGGSTSDTSGWVEPVGDEDDAGSISTSVRFTHEDEAVRSTQLPASRLTIQTFLGFVEKLDDACGTLWLCDGDVTIRRVFDTAFLLEKGIAKEDQPVELRVVVEGGDPKLVLRSLALKVEPRSFKIAEDIDYSEFRVLDE